MVTVVSELIVSMDNSARGTKSPGYYGYSGPELDAYLARNNDAPHRKLVGRKTYEMLDGLPPEARDDGWHKATKQPGYLFSRTLKTCEWTGLQLVREDMVEFVRELKHDEGSELRVLGSLSIMKQLVRAGLLDILRLIICPLVLPESGVERIFEGCDDTAFELVSNRVLDGRVLVVDYRPSGAPPRAS